MELLFCKAIVFSVNCKEFQLDKGLQFNLQSLEALVSVLDHISLVKEN
jgi:hypothetical protein